MSARSELVIRDARPDELEAVARLSVEAYREFADVVGPEMWWRMERNLSRLAGDSPDAVTIVAELEGELVGTVEYTVRSTWGRSAGGSGWWRWFRRGRRTSAASASRRPTEGRESGAP